MISEKKLAYYEYLAFSSVSTDEIQKAITQLVDEVRRLNTATDWLATHVIDGNFCPPNMSDCIDDEINACTKEEAIDCWRRAARKAVKKNDS